MNLLIDIGNTRIKWACEENNTLFAHAGFSYTRASLPELLVRHWGALRLPEQVYIASVVAPEMTARLLEYSRATWSLEPQLAVTEKERAGLTNAYADATTMGVDRWLAMLAAWSRYNRPICVIDCGTAVTVDVILEHGQHAGGFILPGLALASSALMRETHKINEQGEADLSLEPGRSTSACIGNGFALALVGLIQGCMDKIRQARDIELLTVITGGGVAPILPLLPGKYRHEPHLVLEGLRLID